MTTKPAPGRLLLVQEFVNTIDLEGGPAAEELSTPEALRAWLAARALLDPADTPLSPADLARAIELREALRAALQVNHDRTADPAAIAAINRTATTARLVVRLANDGTSSLEPDVGGLEGALGRLLAIVYTAMSEGTWARLKVCRRDKCRWAFYDYSRNRSGSWCSMAVCGNKEKAAAYRRRHAHA